jgi:hypothetical protein
MGEWECSSTFLDLGSRWSRMVSFTPPQLYPRYPLGGRVGPSVDLDYVEKRRMHVLHCQNGILAVQPVTIPTELYYVI